MEGGCAYKAWRIGQVGRTCRCSPIKYSATPTADRNSNSLNSDEELDLRMDHRVKDSKGRREREEISNAERRVCNYVCRNKQEAEGCEVGFCWWVLLMTLAAWHHRETGGNLPTVAGSYSMSLYVSTLPFSASSF